MTNRLKYIDKHQAAAYEQLAAREHQPGNLFAALNEIHLMDGVDVVEFGAGKVSCRNAPGFGGRPLTEPQPKTAAAVICSGRRN